MNISLKCDYPCTNINRDFIFPGVKASPDKIKAIMISEAPPVEHAGYFYESAEGAFFQTTKDVFTDAGIAINNYEDLLNLGFYMTTAIKCSKSSYLVPAKTIKECSKRFLSNEIVGFPNIKNNFVHGRFRHQGR